MSNYKLIYFAGRGMGEPIRQILTYSGTPFEDVRLTELPPQKKEELGLEWGVVPVLEIDGKQSAQTYAICRFLAKKFNLAGKDEAEEYRCDEIVEAIRDYYQKTVPLWDSIFYHPDPVKLEEQKIHFREVDSPVYLTRFNKLLEKQGKTWLVGDGLTWADIMFVYHITQFEAVFELNSIQNYPAIQKLVNAVQNAPKLKEWIETRPKSEF